MDETSARGTAGKPRSASGRRIRVLLVDDHTVLRQSLRLLLNSQDWLEVLDDVSNGREAAAAAENLRPDVVLMDVVMPRLNGLEATRQIRKRCPDTRILILSAYHDDERIIEALRAGASGYLLKDSDLRELLLAIQSVARGNTFFSSRLANANKADDLLLRARDPDAKAGYDRLTSREREVLQLVAEGDSNQAIADQLVISVKTVEAHKAHIMGKLGARNRTDLIRYAVRRGLLGPDSPAHIGPRLGA